MSGSHKLDFDELEGPRKNVTLFELYCQSKLANALFTRALVHRLENSASTVSIHPGIIFTDLWREYGPILLGIARIVGYFILKEPIEGAQTTICCAVTPELENGKYYSECQPTPWKDMIAITKDEEAAEKLWQISERLTGLDKREEY